MSFLLAFSYNLSNSWRRSRSYKRKGNCRFDYVKNKNKPAISFYPVPPESSSGGTLILETMSAVSDERAIINHVADEKSEFKR